jgi:hypothetical protein
MLAVAIIGTTGLLCEMVIGKISVMCLRGEAVVARCLVQYGSTGRNGCVWGEVTRQFRVDCE